MNNTNKDLDESDFSSWMRHPITLKVFDRMKDNQEYLKDQIISLDVLNEPLLDRKVSYLKAGIDLCHEFLNLKFEDLFITEEEEEKDEKAPYTW